MLASFPWSGGVLCSSVSLLWGLASRWPNEQVNAQVFGPEAVLPVEALSLLSVEEEFYLSEKELE